MKKKLPGILLSIAIIATIILPGCSGDNTEQEVITLRYSNFFPGTHYNSILAEQWIEEIESRTNGRVEIEYYPGGQLAAAAQTYDAVIQGICDIGMSVFAYTPGRFPSCELVDLPHNYPNGWVATQVANDFYNNYTPEELDDVHPLYFHATGPYVIFTSKTSVNTMEDLKGLVLRATGIGTQIVEALGAQGYGATQGEVADLLARGVVDGNYSTLESLKTWSQAEVVKYVTNCTAVGNTSMMFVVMSNEKWNSLPSDIQDIISEVSEEFIGKHGQIWTYGDQDGIEYFNSLGDDREVITLSEAEIDKWTAASVKPMIDSYIEEKTAAGYPADEYEQYILERVEYWSSRTPSAESIKSYVESEVVDWTSTTN